MRRAAAAFAAAGAVAAGGCGGDDEQETSAAPPPRSPPADVLEAGSGVATFRLSDQGQQLLRLVGARLEPIPPAERRGRNAFAFPVTGGTVRLDRLSGTLRLGGGLRLVQGGRTGTVRRPVVSFSRKALIAEVNGERMPVLGLDLAGAQRDRRAGTLVVRDVRTTLSRQALDRLRRRLGPAGALALSVVQDAPAGTLTVRAAR